MIHSLQVDMLCKLILAARTHSAKDDPTWAEPVIRLFDLTIFPWRQDFDILYAPVSTSPDYAQYHRWAKLEDYWRSVLFIWNTRLREKLTRRQSRFDKLSTPTLHNVDITYKGNGRTLAGQPKPSGLTLRSAEHLFFRPDYLFRVCGDTITGASLPAFLHTLCAGRAPGEGVCYNFLARVHCLMGALCELHIEPVPTFQYYGAFHD